VELDVGGAVVGAVGRADRKRAGVMPDVRNSL
jgi:hypothetical protein